MRMFIALTALLISTMPAAAQTAAAPPGAAACSGCHDAKIASPSIPPLRGRPAAELTTAMEAFRTGGREATVMGRIAKGFTDDETRAITAWLSSQR